MVKLPRMVLALLGIIMFASTALAAGETYQGFAVVNVIVDGKPLQSDVPAVNLNGRTVLPLRAVAEVAGMNVQWDTASNTATLTSVFTITRFNELYSENQLLAIKSMTLQSDKDRLTAELKTVKRDLETSRGEVKRLTSMSSTDPVFKSSGHAQAATPLFQLDPGVYVVRMTHSGYGHFSIWVYSSTGRRIDLLANVSGAPFSGSKALIIEISGKYLLDISADADWDVTVSRSE